jgi:hypothetical protein
MKMIKAIMFLVLILAITIVYFYTKNDTQKVTSTPTPLVDDTNHKEYKIVQDDKDSVVETNRVLLNKFNALEKKLNQFEKTNQNKKVSVNKSIPNTDDLVLQVVKIINKGLPGINPSIEQNNNGNNTQMYPITDNQPQSSDEHTNTNNKLAYVWVEALRSGTFDENGEYMYITDTLEEPKNNQRFDLADTPILDDLDLNNKQSLKPAYTIPSNSILTGILTTGLLGRIPVDNQVTDPFRFNVKITDKSFYANNHSNNTLQGVFASGTASGDLLLSCVRASIDSITFIFTDGTISDHKISEVAFLANEYGFPCIKGELVTNAVQYLGTSALFSSLSSASKAFSEAEKTITTDENNNSTSNITGSPEKVALFDFLNAGIGTTQEWVNKRTQSSFDVISIPSGKLIKILVQEQINIDYDPNGRKLNHKLIIGVQNNATLD